MNLFKRVLIALCGPVAAALAAPATGDYDLVVYGGTSGGVVAAVHAGRAKAKGQVLAVTTAKRAPAARR